MQAMDTQNIRAPRLRPQYKNRLDLGRLTFVNYRTYVRPAVMSLTGVNISLKSVSVKRYTGCN